MDVGAGGEIGGVTGVAAGGVVVALATEPGTTPGEAEGAGACGLGITIATPTHRCAW